jgi:MFS family permease
MTVRHVASEIRDGGAGEAISAARRRGVLFAMCLSLVLVVASVSSLNLALPDLATSLGASSSAQTWIVDGYTVALAALVLPLGALGDRLGRRNVLLVGTVVFGIAALAASFADSTGTVIACRLTMGAAAAMIMPGTLSTITAVFPADQRAKAVAIWSAFSVSGAVIGLLGAGALLETWGWQSTFLATAVLAAMSFVVALTLAPNTADPDHAHLDLPGGLLSGMGIGAWCSASSRAPRTAGPTASRWPVSASQPRAWRLTCSGHCTPTRRCSTCGSSSSGASAPAPS